MFFHFEEVVGVGEAWKGLQRPCVKHLSTHIMVKNIFSMFFPSWENHLASRGWARLSNSSSKSSKFDLSHLPCGLLESNLWACIPMEAQARLVLPKLSTS
jgi:hypothetical protein